MIKDELEGPTIDGPPNPLQEGLDDFPNRKNYQWGRRFFHMIIGVITALLYGLFMDHNHIVSLLGTLACILYVFEQIRINYPEYSANLTEIMKLIYRAEERLKESAAIPYTIATLLTIIIYPKLVAIAAILTLAIADPLSAIVGIRYGKHRIVPNKSLEGSAAFFASSFICIFFVFSAAGDIGITQGKLLLYSIISAFLCSIAEMLPIRIDDNLTIPLFSAFTLWSLAKLFAISLF